MSNISISIVLHNTYKGELNEVISSCVNSSIPVDIFLIDNSPNDKLSCFKEDARVTYLKSDNKKKVEGLTFEGDGCAISLASASIMTEIIEGKTFEETKEIMNAFLNMIKNSSEIQSDYLDENQKTKLMSLSGVKQFPMRIKCATLSWHTLVSAMEGKKEEVNTETVD